MDLTTVYILSLSIILIVKSETAIAEQKTQSPENTAIPNKGNAILDTADLDIDQNGCISGKAEINAFLQNVAKALAGTRDSLLRAYSIVHRSDVNQDGKICWCDFIAIYLHDKTIQGKPAFPFLVLPDTQMFLQTDKDGDGNLSREERAILTDEFASCLGSAHAQAITDQMANLQGDGDIITLSEFTEYFKEPPQFASPSAVSSEESTSDVGSTHGTKRHDGLAKFRSISPNTSQKLQQKRTRGQSSEQTHKNTNIRQQYMQLLRRNWELQENQKKQLQQQQKYAKSQRDFKRGNNKEVQTLPKQKIDSLSEPSQYPVHLPPIPTQYLNGIGQFPMKPIENSAFNAVHYPFPPKGNSISFQQAVFNKNFIKKAFIAPQNYGQHSYKTPFQFPMQPLHPKSEDNQDNKKHTQDDPVKEVDTESAEHLTITEQNVHENIDNLLIPTQSNNQTPTKAQTTMSSMLGILSTEEPAQN